MTDFFMDCAKVVVLLALVAIVMRVVNGFTESRFIYLGAGASVSFALVNTFWDSLGAQQWVAILLVIIVNLAIAAGIDYYYYTDGVEDE